MKSNYSNAIGFDIKIFVTMCHIVDEYEDFCKKLEQFLWKIPKAEYRNRLAYKLCEISHGRSVINGLHARNFYNDNKDIIDTINKYMDIKEFMWIYNAEQLICLYEYISKNQDKLDKILANLNKLKELGFGYLTFSEDIDFSCEECLLPAYINYGDKIEYLENMEAIPSYSQEIRYKSNDSSYKIVITTDIACIQKPNCIITEEIRSKQIIMNDLTIDAYRLPERISYDMIINKIRGLKEEKKEVYDNIRNSINLAVGLDDLQLALDKFSKITDSFGDVKTKDELVKVLLEMKDELLRMKTISQEYDKNIVANNEFITETLLEEEKKRYVKRREAAKIDLC